MDNPFFSVILPTYNRAHFLDRSIQSVINQTFTDWELIIVDDGSTDNTKEVVEKYQKSDSRIKYIYQENKRLPTARNTGIINSNGMYICFLDSDDQYKSNHLKSHFEAINNSGKKLYYSQYEYSYNNEVVKINIELKKTNYNDKINNILSVFLPYSPPVQCISISRNIAIENLFDTEMNVTEAYDFNARCAGFIEAAIIDKITITLFGHNDNVSIARTLDKSLLFYLNQYKDFKTLRKRLFYKDLINTEEFKLKLIELNNQVIKLSFITKNYRQAFITLLECIRYYPSILFSKKIPILIYQLLKR